MKPALNAGISFENVRTSAISAFDTIRTFSLHVQIGLTSIMYFGECDEQCDMDFGAMLDWQHSLNPATDGCRVTSSPACAMCSSLNWQTGDATCSYNLK